LGYHEILNRGVLRVTGSTARTLVAFQLRALILTTWFLNSALADPAEVILIRHAEKPAVGNELSPRGRERAAALGPYFQTTPDVLDFKTPVAIYAQRPKSEASSVRAIQTVQPLADALRLKINETYTRDEFEGMVEEIRQKPEYQGHTVLICWEHKVIPEIVRKFAVEGAPQTWRDETYDRTWIIKFKAGEKPTFIDFPQRLMFGDSAK
jgi:broad specificity phosphatase PhoE